jgi:hypothetical protein
MPHATVIISSNQPAEYACCGQVLRLHDYKPSFG